MLQCSVSVIFDAKIQTNRETQLRSYTQKRETPHNNREFAWDVSNMV